MSGDQLQRCRVRRVERLALVPGVVDGRKQPEVALGILHDPLLTRPVHKKDHPLLSSRDQVVLLQSMVVQGKCQPEPIGSRVAPCRSWRPYLVRMTRRMVQLLPSCALADAAVGDAGDDAVGTGDRPTR